VLVEVRLATVSQSMAIGIVSRLTNAFEGLAIGSRGERF
jgi:hypothetical protein